MADKSSEIRSSKQSEGKGPSFMNDEDNVADSNIPSVEMDVQNQNEPCRTQISYENSTFKVPILPSPSASLPMPSSAVPVTATLDQDNDNVISGKDTDCDTDNKTDLVKHKEDGLSAERKKNDKPTRLSPAEELTQSPVPYKEPSWGGITDKKFSFEVLKNGVIVDNIDLTQKSYFVFGRLPSCDVTMEHPSLSRYHAVVQYCSSPSENLEKGWYLYDLDSTHGTRINKNRVPPNRYHRIRVGHVVKFGGSTRLNILQGPDDDRDEESELSVTEMKEQRERQKREAEVLKQADLEAESKIKEFQSKETTGCTWGMDEEDAYDITENNPFASLDPEHEELYLDDPKKTLKGYFEREGFEQPEYDVSDGGSGKFRCRVELPLDTPSGQPMFAEAVVSGKKREAVVACALEACRILDRHGVLRASKHESHKRKKKNWEEEDFYESDEDTYLDRTGTIERKRKMRMHKSGKGDGKVETHDSLVEKHNSLLAEISEIEAKLEKAKKDAEAVQADEVDALDAYMMSIKSGAMDTKTKMKLKGQLLQLRQEEMKLRKLVNISKPAAMPELKKNPVEQKKVGLQMFGKMKGVHKPARKPVPEKPIGELVKSEDTDIVEEEDDDDDDDKQNVKTEVGSTNTGTQGPYRNTAAISSTQNQNSDVKNRSGVNFKSPSRNMDEKQYIVSVKNETLNKVLQPGLHSDDSKGLNEFGALKRPSPEDRKVNKKFKPDKKTVSYDDTDPDYAVWLPPKGQAGDGKTHLNAKYGY